MNKFQFLPTLFIAILFLTVAANAQTKIESPPLAANVAPSEISGEASAAVEKKDARAATADTVSVGETSVVNSRSKQQTYVRPSKDARVKRFASEAFGVPSLVGAGIGATIRQIGDTPPEWENNVKGFGRRFASGYATNAIRQTVSFGLSEAFKLDNKYERMRGKNIGKRIKHAFLGSYTTRTPSGKRVPDFPFVAGTYAANVIANEAWFPNRYGYKDGLRDATIALAARFGVTLLREFFFSK